MLRSSVMLFSFVSCFFLLLIETNNEKKMRIFFGRFGSVLYREINWGIIFCRCIREEKSNIRIGKESRERGCFSWWCGCWYWRTQKSEWGEKDEINWSLMNESQSLKKNAWRLFDGHLFSKICTGSSSVQVSSKAKTRCCWFFFGRKDIQTATESITVFASHFTFWF